MQIGDNKFTGLLKRASRVVLVGDTVLLQEFCQKQLAESVALPPMECCATVAMAVEAMQCQAADIVVSTLYSLSQDEVERLTAYCADSATELFALPAHVSNSWHHVQLVQAKGGWMLTQRSEAFDTWSSRICRRVSDMLISLVLLVTIFPIVYVIVAACIKRRGAGSVLVGVKRKDGQGRIYTACFFRTRHQSEEMQLVVGDTLQRTHLCELPQLLNVFMGQMSLVGPQLHKLGMEDEDASALRCFMKRHRVKAGMTGWVRVHQEAKVSLASQRAAEMTYVRDWRLWKYALVLWRTVLVLLLR